MSNDKIKINKRRYRISYRSSRQKSTCYNSLYEPKRENLFISGIGSILNFFGSSYTCKFDYKSDIEATYHDWHTIGQDIAKAKEDFEHHHSGKLSSVLSK